MRSISEKTVAIETTTLGSDENNNLRVRARCKDAEVIYPWEMGLDERENHIVALRCVWFAVSPYSCVIKDDVETESGRVFYVKEVFRD